MVSWEMLYCNNTKGCQNDTIIIKKKENQKISDN